MAAKAFICVVLFEKLALLILMILILVLKNALAHSRKWLAIFDISFDLGVCALAQTRRGLPRRYVLILILSFDLDLDLELPRLSEYFVRQFFYGEQNSDLTSGKPVGPKKI